MNASPRILIIKLSSLGDILHTLPAFFDLRAAFPDATIDWLAAAKCGSLAASIPGIDRLHLLDTAPLLNFPPDRRGWRRIRTLIHELRARRFDCALDFQGLLKTALLASVSGSIARFGFSREMVRERPAHWFYHRTLKKPPHPVHVVQLNRMLAELAGARPCSSAIDLRVSADDTLQADSLLNREGLINFTVINPGGGWPTKRWAPERYGQLARRIQTELGMQVAVTTGPGEDTLFEIVSRSCGQPLPRHLPVSFLQLVPIFRKASLCIGGDTGPFHLACALGTPVVGIFGPTSAVRNGPWRDGEVVVTRSLPCSSCYGRSCRTQNECMDIGVDEVFAGVVRRLRMGEGSVART